MLSFKQINLHRSAQATVLVGRGLESTKRSIILITEPHTVKNRLVGLPSGSKAVYARGPTDENSRPRAAIVAGPDVSLTAMDSWCRRDCAVALARIAGQQAVIVSLYLDINMPVQQKWMEDLMRMIDDKNFPVLVGVDSNAHSALYGPTNNSRGDEFEDFVLRHGFNIENIGHTPTYEVMRGNKLIGTHIDVTLSRDLPSSVKHWQVNRNYNACLLYTSPSPRDRQKSRMPSSA